MHINRTRCEVPPTPSLLLLTEALATSFSAHIFVSHVAIKSMKKMAKKYIFFFFASYKNIAKPLKNKQRKKIHSTSLYEIKIIYIYVYLYFNWQLP